jgi:hypothetical protein
MERTKYQDVRRLIVRLLVFAGSCYAILFAAGWMFEHHVDWRSVQDPRRQLLWNQPHDISRVVLLGDSAFASYYADTPDQMLAGQLAAMRAEPVFPGALNGAQPADLVSQAKVVARNWPAGTAVFIDVMPTRFLHRRQTGKAQDGDTSDSGGEPDANYAADFKYMVEGEPATVEDHIYNAIVHPIARGLFLFRNREAVDRWFQCTVRRCEYFRDGDSRNRIWDVDKPHFAESRYRELVARTGGACNRVQMGALHRIREVLASHGIAAVFVLTPLNKELIRRYATIAPPSVTIGCLDVLHDDVLRLLQANHYDALDLYDSVNASGFADLIHTNENGDRIVARALADWLAARDQRGRRAESR